MCRGGRRARKGSRTLAHHRLRRRRQSHASTRGAARRGRRPTSFRYRRTARRRVEVPHGERVPRLFRHRRGARSWRRRRRDGSGHRRGSRLWPSGVAPQVATRGPRRSRRRGGRWSRRRVRRAGDRRQLLVLRGGPGYVARRIPVGRSRRGRLVGRGQTRRHRRRGLDRDRHLAAALRDRRPDLPRPGRLGALRHDPTRADRQGSRAPERRSGRGTTADG